jgi:hypothetical protein
MIWRALGVWLFILLLANVNGAAREFWIVPSLGVTAGRAISSLLLSGVVFLLTWLTIHWIYPGTRGDALAIGVFWVGLTLAFEFLVGHYVFRKSWVALMEDYDVSRGRIWVLVLLVTMLAPLWAARLNGLFPDPPQP